MNRPRVQLRGESTGLLEQEVGECFGLVSCLRYQAGKSRRAIIYQGLGGLLRLHCEMLEGW